MANSVHFNRFVVAAALVSATLLATSGAALAASTGTVFNVTAQVQTSCQVSASDLAFGTYDPGSATDATGTSTISVKCSLLTPYTLGLSYGANASGNVRQMANGTERLSYQLYQDAAGLNIFGLVSDLLGASGVGTGLTVPTTVYGKIPAGQNVAPGSYSDQITVTLDY